MVDAVVEYDYEPNMSDELQLRVGDVIKDVKPMDGGWWEGALVGGGKRGLFPDNFVKIINNNLDTIPNGKEEKKDNRSNSMKRDSTHKRTTCRVLFNYTPDQDDELALHENDIIECTGEVEDGWWKGTLNGKTGVFPSNFVEVVSQKEEQQVADKNKRNKEFHHQPQVSKPSLDHLEPPPASKDSRIPKLPPKPVKEQCIVQFPYQAQNDDELSLIKGQILNIISKDSEDKGWWRGELDGKIGVFPDNFVKVVKVVNLQEISSGNKKTRAPSPNCDSGNFDKGSREKICCSNNQYHHSHHQQHITESSPSKKGSFGKSNPPPKPKAPCPTKTSSSSNKPVSSAVNIGQPSRGSFLASFKPSLSKSSSSNRSSFSNSSVSHKSGIMSSSPEQTPGSSSPKPLSKSLPNNIEESLDRLHSEDEKSGKEFDGVSRTEKLAHPTADRVKGPKRRPPSSIFTKDVIALEDQNDDQNSDTIDPSTNDIERNNSSSSVKEIKDDAGNNVDDEHDHDPDSEPIQNRVKDESSVQNTNASLPNSKSSSPVNAFKEELQSRLENHSGSAAADSEVSQVKKPDWLEELSRKQANRKSGFFNDKVTGSRSSAPMILDKPQLPTKPSQIRDDLRKLNKRASNIETSGSSDKENNRPNRPSSIGDPSAHSDINSNTPTSSVVPAEARNPRISDEFESKSQSRKLPFSDKKSQNQESDEDHHQSLVQRVAKLESALIMYSERLHVLEEAVKEERDLRLKLQEELDELRK